MNNCEDRTPPTREVAVAETTRASWQVESADPLLSQLRADLRPGQIPEWRTPEQQAAVVRIKEALKMYAAFFYPPDPR